MTPSPLHYTHVSSPVGKLMLVASGKGLCGLWFENGESQKYAAKMLEDGALVEDANHKLLTQAANQLAEYFAGKRKTFDIKLDMQGTIFQQKAWRELQKIPYGQTISYAEQAARIDNPKKARAVGVANGRNPLAIVVPCHRVIGSDGSLTGFAGGMNTKQYLLEHELKYA
ncbi:MAG: methylated-DNA--[protein]-cysteine S-methyltransferase [Alphaproteobacteria bacterium]|nr:methylated-DNA--[protein]-cysteine S-methyltransferase [Alphaproteobacteria bacterium]